MNGQNGCKSKSELQNFDNVFDELTEFLKENVNRDNELDIIYKHFEKVNNYNVPFGKKTRGMAVAESLKLINPSVTEKELRLARIVGWCIEWLQAMFLVHDDIMDNSVTRRGQPCWYRQPEIGIMAINDGLYLESAIYAVLKKFCRKEKWYMDVVEIFHEITLQTVQGQSLDMISSPTDRLNFQDFTIERYKAIIKYKTAFYSFVLPVRCALFMNGNYNGVDHDSASEILLEIGEYFQIQDDFLDAFGDPKVTGKIGTDIEDNKCGWLIVKALELSDKNTRTILSENYAKSEKTSVQKVKDIFLALKIPAIYEQLENDYYKKISESVKKQHLPADIFLGYLNKIHKRQK